MSPTHQRLVVHHLNFSYFYSASDIDAYLYEEQLKRRTIEMASSIWTLVLVALEVKTSKYLFGSYVGVRTGTTREGSNATTKQNQSLKKDTGELDPTGG